MAVPPESIPSVPWGPRHNPRGQEDAGPGLGMGAPEGPPSFLSGPRSSTPTWLARRSLRQGALLDSFGLWANPPGNPTLFTSDRSIRVATAASAIKESPPHTIKIKPQIQTNPPHDLPPCPQVTPSRTHVLCRFSEEPGWVLPQGLGTCHPHCLVMLPPFTSSGAWSNVTGSGRPPCHAAPSGLLPRQDDPHHSSFMGRTPFGLL